MIRRLGPLAVALMLTALFAVGCGDDDNGDSGDSGGTATEQVDTGGGTATESEDTSTESSDSGDVSDNPQVQAAVEACKQQIASNPAVKDDIKADLQGICEKAASGDEADVKAAIKEVCVKIVESSVPSGSAQDTAKQACEQAGG